MPHLASLINKRRLDMPLTSFNIALSKDAQQRIFRRVQTSKRGIRVSEKPMAQTERQGFYRDMSLSQRWQGKINEVDMKYQKPLFIVKDPNNNDKQKAHK